MFPGRVFRAAVVAVLAAGASLCAASAASAACPKGARCGTVTVPLDHAGAVAGTVPLAYATLPATGTRAGTLVLLSGGPGQAALPLASSFARLLRPVREHYDIVAVDQRGTGDSGAVSCSLRSPRDVERCAETLGSRRAFWSTAETAMDLEDLRRALGVDKLTLFGVSYGAKVASEYARRYPAAVAGLILDSPAPVDGLDGYDQLRVLGTPRVLREVCHPGACHATVGDPEAALQAAVARLRRGAVRGPLVSPTGKVRRSRVGEAQLYAALAESDLDPRLRAGLPAAIASLAAGDAAPFLHLQAILAVAGGADGDTRVNSARLLATSCLEGRLPWAPDSPVAAREGALKAFVAARTEQFAPFRPATVLAQSAAALCANWPPTAPPAPVAYAGPDVPVLVLSGREDLRTPLEDARRTAGQYPNAKVLAVPGAGHSVLSTDVTGCAGDGVSAFLSGAPVAACRVGGKNLSAPFAPASIGALRPTGVPGLPGRTFSAVRVTLAGLAFEEAIAFGQDARLPGLRGGYLRATKTALELHAVEWIRGVRVSGRLTARGGGTLTVSGPAAAPGTLAFTRTRVTGTLGGVRVNAR